MSEFQASPSAGKLSTRKRAPLIVWFAVAAACALLLAGWLIWRDISRAARDATSCVENVKRIVVAMHNYHDTLGCFPPAYVTDSSGRPIHSWRVLLLPYLGQKALYDQYRFDEAWDGPHNKALGTQVPRVFQCPADRKDKSNTSYVVVTGAGTTFPGAQSRRISDLLDGTGNTILFVEIADSGINWMEPRDLTYEQALAGIGSRRGGAISSRHGGVAMAATADGSIWALPENLPRDTLRKLVLCNDGETIPEFGSPKGSAVEAPHAEDVHPSEGGIFK